MTIDEFVSQGWQDHAADAEGVWARLPDGVRLADTPAGLFALANLATHVAGEHLGRWDEGVAFLEALTSAPAFHPATDEGKALRRLQAVLDYCAGRTAEADGRILEGHPEGAIPLSSTRIRVLAPAASALANQHRLEEANAAFDEALRLAAYGPGAEDPAARALAVTGNNLACSLEELPARDEAQRQLMLRAAAIGRRYWEVAGGWMEVERAEYRLAMSHLAANLPKQALVHASTCLRVVEENGAVPGELFFAREALGRVQHALGDAAAAKTERDHAAAALPEISDAGFKEFCLGELQKLDAMLGA